VEETCSAHAKEGNGIATKAQRHQKRGMNYEPLERGKSVAE
jgi:hypothetical protein